MVPKIAPSTYYEWRDKLPTARDQRDEVLLDHIRRVHADNFGVYGPRKVCRKGMGWPGARSSG